MKKSVFSMSILALMCLISCNTPTAKEVEEKELLIPFE